MKNNLPVTVIASLWSTYVNNSLDICVKKHALKYVEDAEIKEVLTEALSLSERILQETAGFLNEFKFEIPKAFGESDVNESAPRLYTDQFWLFYIYTLTAYGLQAYSLASASAIKYEIRRFFKKNYDDAFQIYEKSFELLLTKSLFAPMPMIPISEQPQTVKDKGFLAEWLGGKRPLNAVEIASIFYNLSKSTLSKALLVGFAQTAQSEKVRAILENIIKTAEKNTRTFGKILDEDGLSAPSAWDSHVTDSKAAPFSDRLIMHHAAFLAESAVAYYGVGMSSSMRPDLAAKYEKAIALDIAAGAEAANFLLEHGWLIRPPQSADREALAAQT